MARKAGSSAARMASGAWTSAALKARPITPAAASSAAVAVGNAVVDPPAFAVIAATNASV